MSKQYEPEELAKRIFYLTMSGITIMLVGIAVVLPVY
jgi:hypothetical protein